ncbi:glycoside hydrolase family 43 protein [Aspergillus lucknowensis]|uniref:Glycosyl hydrolase n=1 Tax=Aspergillus lucknowensis TaxID=176173 RepID=A0ABR4LSR3_9EURO
MPSMHAVLLALVTATYTLAEPLQVINFDFPDPAIIHTEQGYYAFGTQSNGVLVPVARSDDFASWTLLEGTDALPGPFPAWVQADIPNIWAPDVIQRDDGNFVLYYSATSSDDNSKHCIGAAVSPSIEGPYTPEANALACPLAEGGAIDAAGFRDTDGTHYVVYKVDGNSLNGDGTLHPTPILLQQLDVDAVTPVGGPVQLIDREDADGPLVEAPSLIVVDGTYYLSFSSNMYDSLLYDVSYATASSVAGPYTKVGAPDAPLLVSGDGSNVGPLGGPGGADLLDDGTKIAFHAFIDGQGIGSGRGVWVSDIQVGGGVITIA